MKSNDFKILTFGYFAALILSALCQTCNAQIIAAKKGDPVPYDSAAIMELWRYRELRSAYNGLQRHADSLHAYTERAQQLDSLCQRRIFNLGAAMQLTENYAADLEGEILLINQNFTEYVKATEPPKGFFRRAGWHIKRNWRGYVLAAVTGYALE